MGLSRLKTINIPMHKTTMGSAVIPITVPGSVAIPMLMHKGAAAEPVVQPGDRVCVGQLIGKSCGAMSVPVHSSVSGTVRSFEEYETEDGVKDIRIVIDADGRQEIYSEIKAPEINSTADFIEAVELSGLVGLGGAGFPLAEKFASCLDVKVDTLIINAAECEPFITVDVMTLISHCSDLIAGAKSIMKWLGIDRCVLACAENDLIKEKVMPAVSAEERFSVCFVGEGYPSGSENNIIMQAAGRKLLPGRIPPDVGCLVCNVNTVVKLQHFLLTGMPLVSKNITVDGDVVKNPVNLQVPVGTRIKDVLEFCGGCTEDPSLILLGGVMMGKAAEDEEYALGKPDNAVLCFGPVFSSSLRETACINCGQCIRVCQMGLMPLRLSEAFKHNDIEKLEKYHVADCFGCGACSYVCPARKPLAREILLAQRFIKEIKEAENE